MSTLDMLLSRLENVRKTPPRAGIARAYRACCPAHQGSGKHRSTSLSVAESDSGALLLHCFAGCSVDEIAGAAGVELADLFPSPAGGGGRGNGGPRNWLSVAALLDQAEDAAARAVVGMCGWDELLSKIADAKNAARAAARAQRAAGGAA